MGNMILYVGNPKDSTHTHKKPLRTNKPVHQSNRAQRQHKKSVVLLYTAKKQYKQEIKKIIPFAIASKI